MTSDLPIASRWEQLTDVVCGLGKQNDSNANRGLKKTDGKTTERHSGTSSGVIVRVFKMVSAKNSSRVLTEDGGFFRGILFRFASVLPPVTSLKV